MTAMVQEFDGVRELSMAGVIQLNEPAGFESRAPRELSTEEIDAVAGGLGLPGGIIGAVGGGAAYIATHVGGGTSGNASAGGFLAAVGGGGLTGAAAGATGGYIGMGIAAVGGAVTAGTSAAIDSASN